jgi:hypothetical protein
MLTPTFNQSYTVKLVVTLDSAEHQVGELAKSLQTFYDGDCAPAGQFWLELVGQHLIVTLLRDIGEDLSATNHFVDRGGMTQTTVQDQLEQEYSHCIDQLPVGTPGQVEALATMICLALRRHHGVVEGLPCQMVLIRLQVQWVAPAGITGDDVVKRLQYLASSLDGMLSIPGVEREYVKIIVDRPATPQRVYNLIDLVKP